MRRELVAAALLLRFLLELALFATAAVWGWQVRGWWFAVLVVLATVALWGALLSPRAPVALPWPARAVLEAVVWVIAVAALFSVGRGGLGLALAGVVLIDLGVLIGSGEWLRHDVTLAIGSRARRGL